MWKKTDVVDVAFISIPHLPDAGISSNSTEVSIPVPKLGILPILMRYSAKLHLEFYPNAGD